MANNRIWLRLPDNNPIWNIPSEIRSQVADQWLRQGATMQDFNLLVQKLDQYITQLAQPTAEEQIKKPTPTNDTNINTDKAKLAQNLVKSCNMF